jgi:hypothetical protein
MVQTPNIQLLIYVSKTTHVQKRFAKVQKNSQSTKPKNAKTALSTPTPTQ